MLKKILYRMPNLNKDDFDFFLDEEKLSLQQSLYEKPKNKISLKELFPLTNQGLVDLLELMLTYNPIFRPTAKQLLKMKIFDDIKCTHRFDTVAPHKIAIKYDKDPRYRPEYDDQSSNDSD